MEEVTGLMKREPTNPAVAARPHASKLPPPGSDLLPCNKAPHPFMTVMTVKKLRPVWCVAVYVLVGLAAGCGPAPAPEILTGEGIVEKIVVPDRRIVIAHEDIPGFMDAMTMSFEVNKPSLLHKLKPRDRIRFTLERTKLTLYLVAAEKIAGRRAEGKDRGE